ncbi:Bifunctional protein FolD 2 [Diplonema papillatum]|nr:Bifunctional protein FolD 2 [Diplonema papillatum]
MTAEIIDGKKVAADIREQLKAQAEKFSQDGKGKPGLAVIIVGERKDSQTYVRLKHKAAHECGFESFQIELPADVTQADLEAKVQECNWNKDIHGLIVQLPLPKHLDEVALTKIAAEKDVDGLGPANIAALYTRGTTPLSYPCTPKGIIALLEASGTPLEGARAAVIGRSNIVGLPVANMLMEKNATVTICHSRTPDVAAVTRECDIIVAAAGSAGLVKDHFVKPGATIIDVGTNCVDDPSKKLGYRTVGDVDFEACKEVAGKITPVPGGVGPMTIAMLLSNTLDSFKRSIGA